MTSHLAAPAYIRPNRSSIFRRNRARAELVLLGMTSAVIDRLTTPSTVTATTGNPAPIEGAVIERQANPGLNVDPSMSLFTIADLSTVWAGAV